MRLTTCLRLADPLRALFACCVLGALLLLSVGCQPTIPGQGTPDFCQQDADCGAQSTCLNQLCVSKTMTPDAAGQLWDSIPSYQCNIGDTKSCSLDGGDTGTMLCIKGPEGRGVWSNVCGCKAKTKKNCYTGPQETRGKGACKEGQQTCGDDGTWGECVGEVKPKQEECNGTDDDCDGEVDEGLIGCRCEAGTTQPCYPGDIELRGIGACKEGTQTCGDDGKWSVCKGAGSPTEETCNGKDDDCDGQVDETFPTLNEDCSAGVGECKGLGSFKCNDKGDGVVCSAKAKEPQKEECNGKDDDCDGHVDLGPSGDALVRDCYNGPSGTKGNGRCKAGTQTCKGAKWSDCDGEIKPEPKELCDGEDNDCNGKVDDLPGCSCVPGTKAPCYNASPWTNGYGVCKSGERKCDSNGSWGKCIGEVKPSAEECNNKDDDCDGTIDEGLFRPCELVRDGCVKKALADGRVAVVCQGQCQAGLQLCSSGKWSQKCSGAILPAQEICDGKDNDCDGSTDEGNPDGGADCVTNGKGPCGKGKLACANGALKCHSTHKLTQEICNGVDDDCDGSTDEDSSNNPLQQECYSGAAGTKDKGPCKGGFQVCSGGSFGLCQNEVIPTQEICDGKDNDCNGKVDDGIQCNCKLGDTRDCGSSQGECAKGKQECGPGGNWGPCVGGVRPQLELCDGKDNDCDGQIDESFPRLGSHCSVGQGQCMSNGKYICHSNRISVICDARPGSPSPESCDGKDNDCDGQIDEELTGFGKSCVVNNLFGPCAKGETVCANGRTICKQLVFPAQETCNGLDDDCNRTVDDNLVDVGKICRGSGVGICSQGSTKCVQAKLVCDVPKPESESCNGLDDDCDGTIDEICGGRHNYIAFYDDGDSNNALRGYLVDSTSNIANGEVSFSSLIQCAKQPLIITTQSSQPSGATYSCNGLKTTIHTFARSGSSGASLVNTKVPFHAIAPKTGIYGVVSCQKNTSNKLECKVSSNRPTAIAIDSNLYPGAGVIKLYTNHCREDRTISGTVVRRPFFATLLGAAPGYIQTWSAGNAFYTGLGQTGKCEVKMFNASGGFTIRSFAFWFPPKDAEVWAGTNTPQGSSTLDVVMETSDFNNGYKASWSASYSSSLSRLELKHPAWANPFSLVIATPQFFNYNDSTPYLISAEELSSGGNQIGLYTFKRGGGSTTASLSATDQPSILLYGRRF